MKTLPVGTLQPGTLFAADYRVVRLLGEGGMGAVYVAEQLSTGKLRALKTMHPQYVSDAGMRERFVREAQIGARIESVHVVDVLAAGIDERTKMPWLSMELLKGETLDAAAARGAMRSPRDVSACILQLGAALAEAHAAGVVHRDLKPENLFLAGTKHTDVPFVLKVLDFGIAKLVAQQTSATASIGTPLWMAPEQADVAGVISGATDVWAYGLVAFFALTGHSYWDIGEEGELLSMASVLRQIVVDPLPRASMRAQKLGVAQRLPPGFDNWFARCVARDPRSRFATGADALRAAQRVFCGMPPLTLPLDAPIAPVALMPTQLASPTPAPFSRTNPPASPPLHSRKPLVAVAVFAAAVVASGAALVVHETRSPAATILVSPPPPPPPKAETTVTLTAPPPGAVFAAASVEMKWTDTTSSPHEIEVARLDGAAATTTHAPPGLSYVMWPWHGAPAPGAYQWRVRSAEDAWSGWSDFTFYPSILDRVHDRKKLRVGMEATYHAPFVFFDSQKNEVRGFDVALADAIAEKLGVEVERETHEWKDLFSGVETRELDVVISAVTITKERRQKASFSEPYLRTGVVMTTRTSGPRRPATIGAQRGTTAALVTVKRFPQASLHEYDTFDAAFAAFSHGEVEALLSDETVMRARPELASGGYRVDRNRLTSDGYGIMLPVGDDVMKAALDKALAELTACGRLALMKQQYGLSP